VSTSSARSTSGPTTRTSAIRALLVSGWGSPGWHPLTVAALDDFNAEPAERAAEVLQACNAAPSFAEQVLAGRPYADAESLVARAEQIARALPWDEVATALAAHPRIGDRVEGSSAEAQASRKEQSSMGGAAVEVRAALMEGNRAYEERFDHVFLIRAVGRSPEEMLAELRRRLTNDEAEERAEVTEQLAQITGLRVRGMVA
jgi:2-oxo-4-hydroxy-4-carboxy-5-ureidoimidazoline decarboxylase